MRDINGLTKSKGMWAVNISMFTKPTTTENFHWTRANQQNCEKCNPLRNSAQAAFD